MKAHHAIAILVGVGLNLFMFADTTFATNEQGGTVLSRAAAQSREQPQRTSSPSSLAFADSPQLTFGSYLSGSHDDAGTDVAVDDQGFIYLAGSTFSPDWPVVNAVQPMTGGAWDGYLIKLDPVTYTPVFSTFFGGSGWEDLRSVKLDAAGNIYLFGTTNSSDLPTVNAYQNQNAGGWDLFVAKLSNDGSQILYSTYLGGSANEGDPSVSYTSGDMVVSDDGYAYITSRSASGDFPLVNPYFDTSAGGTDVVIAELDPAGQLVYSTYFGSSGEDWGVGIDLTSTSDICIAVSTGGSDFPLLNAFNSTNTSHDAAIIKLTGDGQNLLLSSYIGGSNLDYCSDLTVDVYDNVWVIGSTYSTDFPLVDEIRGKSGELDQFITKISPTNTVSFSTYFGGSDNDLLPERAAASPDGSVYFVGQSESDDFPLKAPFWPLLYTRTIDIAFLKFDALADTLIWSTKLTTPGVDWPSGLAVVGDQKILVTGDNIYGGLPSFKSYQSYNSTGNYDGFILEFSTLNIARGDADASGAYSIADAVFIVNYIFGGGPAPLSLTAADADSSFSISIADAVWMINYIFGGGPPPGSAH